MRSPAHVVVVTPGFPGDESDTTCIPPLQILLRRLSRRHPELRVSVIALHYPHRRTSYGWHGIEVHPAGGNNRPLAFRLPSVVRALSSIRRCDDEQRVDVIHSLWLSDTTLLGWWAARRLGIPLVATAMGQDVLESNRWLRVLPIDRATVTAVSRRASEALGRSWRRTADAVTPWGLDPPPGTPPSWDDREIDLLGVGSLTGNKDFSAVVEIAARLRAEGRKIRAVIVGDGPQRSRIAELIASEGLGDTIRLAGRVERDEVLRSMSRSKILVHPSHYESFGFVFSEAVAQGMTVVSRPVGIAEPSVRWRVADTTAALADACSSVLDDPPETRSLALFTEDEAADGWIRTYDAAAGSR